MPAARSTSTLAPVVVPPEGGRRYPMGPVSARFLADQSEGLERYSVSEWWLEPYTKGPGAHRHPEDDVFYVIEGTMTFLVGDRWVDAPKGSLVIAPGGVAHDFQNRTAARAGALNFSVPGPFEAAMDGIAAWFRARSPKDARTDPPVSVAAPRARSKAAKARETKAKARSTRRSR